MPALDVRGQCACATRIAGVDRTARADPLTVVSGHTLDALGACRVCVPDLTLQVLQAPHHLTPVVEAVSVGGLTPVRLSLCHGVHVYEYEREDSPCQGGILHGSAGKIDLSLQTQVLDSGDPAQRGAELFSYRVSHLGWCPVTVGAVVDVHTIGYGAAHKV